MPFLPQPSGPDADFDLLPRPGARLLADAHAHSGPVRHQHASLRNLEPLVEQRLQPFEMLHPGLARIGGGQMHVEFHREVRGEQQSGIVGLPRDFDEAHRELTFDCTEKVQ